MAAPPRTKTTPSCRPAVPPPPVAGAPVGKGDVVVGSGDGLTVVWAGVGVVALVLGEVGCVVVGEASGEVLAVSVPVADDDSDVVPPGTDGAVDGGVPVQAETASATRTIKAAQVRTASRRLLAGLAVMRTFMEPP